MYAGVSPPVTAEHLSTWRYAITIRTVFIIDAVASALVGVVMLFVPVAFLGFARLETNDLGLDFLRSYGAGLLSVGVMAWLAMNSKPSTARTGLLVGVTLCLVTDAVNEAWATLARVLHATPWLTVAELAVIAALSIVVGLRSRSEV